MRLIILLATSKRCHCREGSWWARRVAGAVHRDRVYPSLSLSGCRGWEGTLRRRSSLYALAQMRMKLIARQSCSRQTNGKLITAAQVYFKYQFLSYSFARSEANAEHRRSETASNALVFVSCIKAAAKRESIAFLWRSINSITFHRNFFSLCFNLSRSIILRALIATEAPSRFILIFCARVTRNETQYQIAHVCSAHTSHFKASRRNKLRSGSFSARVIGSEYIFCLSW